MAITHAIVHYIEKPAGQEARLSPRQSELPLSPHLEALISKLNATYNNRSGKIYGGFESDEQAFPFAGWLRSHLEEQLDFVALSQKLLERFKAQLEEREEELSGYLMLARMRVLETEQLLVLMLSTTPTVVIDEQLELSDSRHLDVGKVQLGAKINLDEWRKGADGQYVSFLRGRGGKGGGEAFCASLGCTEESDSRVQTQTLLKVFDNYCSEEDLGPGEASQIKQAAYDYCQEQVESGDRVRLKDLSRLIDTTDPDKFFNYAGEQEAGLQAEIPADKRGLQKFVRYAGSMKGLSVSFSDMLLGEQVLYDPATDTLTIRGTPPTLRKQLNRGSD
ncbi:nucleoid-associated protein [Motiliproteus sp. SC1-56]|uniref:nucleoid-associated protein n=1 Tax=Motiliproteus sp. SC1-56 TaxID=2799565 RepID=UPI001A8DAADC|nr:nucleoid-associated protein [Motiliproteus sp. SC1-56]